ncbi:type VI secretion ATPase, ClpV1 family domain protein [Burkholderia pseudomallei TSV28]|nr:type VI secretion ATPase, ClpV1 family domain protein [Burkholderia pseudomallei TSV28]
MLTTTIERSSPNSASATASAVSVLPVPDGPASRNTPSGRRGSWTPAAPAFTASEICSIA